MLTDHELTAAVRGNDDVAVGRHAYSVYVHAGDMSWEYTRVIADSKAQAAAIMREYQTRIAGRQDRFTVEVGARHPQP